MLYVQTARMTFMHVRCNGLQAHWDVVLPHLTLRTSCCGTSTVRVTSTASATISAGPGPCTEQANATGMYATCLPSHKIRAPKLIGVVISSESLPAPLHWSDRNVPIRAPASDVRHSAGPQAHGTIAHRANVHGPKEHSAQLLPRVNQATPGCCWAQICSRLWSRPGPAAETPPRRALCRRPAAMRSC